MLAKNGFGNMYQEVFFSTALLPQLYGPVISDNKLRIAIIKCCGKTKCSKSFSKTASGGNSSFSQGGNRSVANKNKVDGKNRNNGKVINSSNARRFVDITF